MRMTTSKLARFKKNGHARGFTIVETLVAITILMISIAGPLVVASKGLTAALYARDQMTASFLAQESMEVVKNAHDNNMATLATQTSWLSYFQPDGAGNVPCTKSNPCDASAIGSVSNTWNMTSGASDPLQIGDLGYGLAGSVDSIFTRYFYMSDPASPDISNPVPCSVGLTECAVTVIVSWHEGVIPYQVALSSEITKILR